MDNLNLNSFHIGPQNIPAQGVGRSQDARNNVEIFREKFCPGVSANELRSFLDEGAKLEAKLLDAAGSDEKWEKLLADKEITNPKSAVHFIWRLHEKAALQGDLFTSGAMRLGKGEPLTAEKLERFLIACGQGQAYSRISTHMKENLTKSDTQWGLDLRGMGLPSSKNTILFAKQTDGTLYVKIEEHGCPPFWTKKFASIKNFSEFVGHGIDYITSRPMYAKIQKIFVKGPADQGSKLQQRREKVPEYVSAAFKKTMYALHSSKEAKALYKEGKKFGISRMEQLLKKNPTKSSGALTSEQEGEQLHMQVLLAQYTNSAKARGYIGDIKGDEVTLPPLGS